MKKIKSDRAQRCLREIILVHHACSMKVAVLHAGTMFGTASATSACPLALVHLGGHIYIFSFWSFYSQTRPAERHMAALSVNQFLYWVGALFSKLESESEVRRYPSAR